MKKFLIINSSFASRLGAHIFERYEEVAEEILKLDGEIYPYFVFKNTSVDDEVEHWFRGYDKKKKKNTWVSLKENNDYVAEFVIIEDKKITGFVSNIEYFSLQRNNK